MFKRLLIGVNIQNVSQYQQKITQKSPQEHPKSPQISSQNNIKTTEVSKARPKTTQDHPNNVNIKAIPTYNIWTIFTIYMYIYIYIHHI